MLPLSKTFSLIKKKRRSSSVSNTPASSPSQDNLTAVSESSSASVASIASSPPRPVPAPPTHTHTPSPLAPATVTEKSLPEPLSHSEQVAEASPAPASTQVVFASQKTEAAVMPATMEAVKVSQKKQQQQQQQVSSSVTERVVSTVSTVTTGGASSVAVVSTKVHSNGSSTNGSANGSSRQVSSAKQTQVITRSSGSSSSESRVVEVVKFVEGLFNNLGDYEASLICGTSIQSYLAMISDQRLIHMPRKGSEWDRVLRTAQFYGLQIWNFGQAVAKFAPESQKAAGAAVASCSLLIEIGHQQASALLPAFMTLYELGLLISQVTRIPGLFDSPKPVKDDISRLYVELVNLGGRMAVLYRNRLSAIDRAPVSIDIDAEFGDYIDTIWASKEALYEKIWAQSLGQRSLPLDVSALRQLLGEESGSFRNELYSELAEDLERAEDTCEWVKGDLVDFLESDEKLLTVTGPAGSGKTVLADWIEERLQRPLQDKTYNVLLHTFPYDNVEDSTATSFLKGVLLQLLERSVGNVQMLEALVNAFAPSHSKALTNGEAVSAEKELESQLWRALYTALNTFKNNDAPIVLLIDGVEQVGGGDDGQIAAFFQSLRENVQGAKNARVITFSRKDHKLGPKTKHIDITAEVVNPDIQTFLRQTLSRSSVFMELAPLAREKIIFELTQKSKGSFLWARLSGHLLLQDFRRAGFKSEAVAQAAGAVTSDLHEVLHAIGRQTELQSKPLLREMLSFMVIFGEPFKTQDLSDILAVNLAGKTKGQDAVDISGIVSAHVPDLVLVRDGCVRFKSSSIRSYFQKELGKSLPAAAEAHGQLAMRLLLYIKLSLSRLQHGEPSMDEMDDYVLRKLKSQNRLLVFAMAHWLEHFRQSSLLQKGHLRISPEFRASFPDTPAFALMEQQAWAASADLTERLKLTLQIREATFGDKHVTVLQTLILLGKIYLSLGETTESARYYYRAVQLGRILLARANSVTVSCMDIFLSITESMSFTSRTEMATYREEMIRFKIEICKERFGASSRVVLEWYERLSAFYVLLREEKNKIAVDGEIWSLVTVLDGKDSERARTFIQGLNVEIKDFKTEEEVRDFGQVLLETIDDVEVNDALYVSVVLQWAKTYEARQMWSAAERVYIGLWRRISALQSHKEFDVYLVRIQVAMAYVAFLKIHSRKEEAVNILMAIWTETENRSIESVEMITITREIGILFKEFGVYSVSASILSKVWSWYEAKGQVEDEEARRTTVMIREIVQEITETTVEEKTTVTQTVETTEKIIRSAFESETIRSQKSGIDTGYIESAMATIKSYRAVTNWEEVEVVARKSLEVSWSGLLSADEKVRLSDKFSVETVQLGVQLAVSYEEQHQFEKAEVLYRRMYQAAGASRSVEDALFVQTLSTLITFYEKHHRHERVIAMYDDLVAKYRTKLGASHRLTIQALYTLAGQYELLGHKEAYQAYGEIVSVLNKGRKHCHVDAFRAAVALVRYYYVEKRVADLRAVCGLLWECFVSEELRASYAFTEAIVSLVYEKYMYTLEQEKEVDLARQYDVAAKYRETVSATFGRSSAAFVEASLSFAGVCERSAKTQYEAVRIYEDVISIEKSTKTTTTVVTERTLHTVRKRLSKVYVTVITSGKAAKSINSESISRAVVVSLESYAHLQVEYGISHKETLLKLRDIVVLYQKLNTKESHSKVLQLLQTTVVEIFSKVTVAVELFAAAAALGDIYVSCGLRRQGLDLLQEMRYALVFGGHAPKNLKYGQSFNFSQISSRTVFLFLAAFEARVLAAEGQATASFSDLLSSLMYEVLLYEEYRKVVASQEEAIEVILAAGARLRAFWVDEKKSELVQALDAQLFAVFQQRYVDFVKVTDEQYAKIFYVGLLQELAQERAESKFVVTACVAGHNLVRAHLTAGDFATAVEVARFAFTFVSKQHYYGKGRAGIAHGYKLAELLAGVDVRAPTATDPNGAALREKLLALSRIITDDVFAVLRASNVDLASLEVKDVAGMVRLLGAQSDYVRLESFLLHLWQSREVRRTWKPATVLSIGFALVHAYAGQKGSKLDDAIDLAGLLWYNLRRSRGILDPDAVKASQLLGSLYIEAGRVSDAMGIYEGFLRQIEAAASGGQRVANGKALTSVGHTEDAVGDRKLLAAHAQQQLELMGVAYARLGRWAKSKKEYQELYEHLRDSLSLNELPAAFDKWVGAPRASGMVELATYSKQQDWVISGVAAGKELVAQ